MRAPSALLVLMALSAAACASSGNPRPRPFPGAPPPPESTTTAPAEPSVLAPSVPGALSAIVDTAMKLRGVPYRNGGSDPSGFDCSGFVQWVFAKNGVVLPREVREQYGAGHKIGLSEVQPGDLVFFETVSRGASHVGLVIGSDQFVHAPSSTGVVRIERLTATYWARRFVGARRIAGDSSHQATQ
ncbi:MAG TPA: C40 family peptidase [Vicinamibacterales bacterium]|nr:C40 family peptidase [Vicinamibacterales bacterium]